MIKPPYTKWINDIKTKLGINRTMTASGDDVVDAVNKQSQQIDDLQAADGIIVDGDSATETVNEGQYAYIKNNTHGLDEGLYVATASFPTGGGTAADRTYFQPVTNGGINHFENTLSKEILPDKTKYTYLNALIVRSGSTYRLIAFVPSYLTNTINITISNIGYCGITGIKVLTAASVTPGMNTVSVETNEDISSYVGYAGVIELLNI